MKAILFALCAVIAGATCMSVITAPLDEPHLLGANKCTWGPGYWCANITTATGCNTMKHCIHKVWEKITVKDDDDNVCEICKEMVTQARKQLESNQTQNDLKAVFEGSCKLMVYQPIVKECYKLVDNFIPQLVETLASQMNPSVVCSVSGLCNSRRIDKLLDEYHALKAVESSTKPISLMKDELKPDECTKCYTIASHMVDTFGKSSRDDVLKKFISVCGTMGSFSDACSNLLLLNFETIYTRVEGNFTAKNICHLTGQCSGLYHIHEDGTEKIPAVEIRPLSSVGMVEIGDDLPCELCEKLVMHLRDILVAENTESEFKDILEGFCNQTKSFSSECRSIVDQYYSAIYEFLVNGLNAKAICELGGICPSPGTKMIPEVYAPLLPPESAKIGLRIWQESKKNYLRVESAKNSPPKSEADDMQLPNDRLLSSSLLSFAATDPKGQKTCAFCEFLLRELQQYITKPVSEAYVKTVVKKICKKLPEVVNGTCVEFIDTYGELLISLFAQGVDSSLICPKIAACPSKNFLKAWKKLPTDMMIKSDVQEKPSCPLCLLAITQIDNVIKENKTEENIRNALDKLCNSLPTGSNECISLVETYSKYIIDALLADFDPQEVCVYIKLCDDTRTVMPSNMATMIRWDDEILTNEISIDHAIQPVTNIEDDSECAICEVVIKYIEDNISKKSTENEIENLIHNMCNHLPLSYKQKCNDFVSEYGDAVIQLLVNQVSPKQICSGIGMCQSGIQQIKAVISKCAECEIVMSAIDSDLRNSKVDHNISRIVTQVCDHITAGNHSTCVKLLHTYKPSLVNLLTWGEEPQNICTKLGLCSNSVFAMSRSVYRDRRGDDNLGVRRCTWGDDYRCANTRNADECGVLKYCTANVWKTAHPASVLKNGFM